MQLLILAAGFGGRLSPATDETPKALLEVSEGITILDLQLDAARKAGINKIHIVVGFEAGKIEKKIREEKFKDLKIVTHYNPFYGETNNLVSLWMARTIMNQDFIMLNGDSVFRPKMLQTLLNSEEQITVMIAKKSAYDSDDTKLKLHNGLIKKLSKKLPSDEIDAEWIGMCSIKGDSRELFLRQLERLIRVPSMLKGHPHYLSVFQELANRNTPLNTIEITSDTWHEVDYQMDLDFIRAHITRYLD